MVFFVFVASSHGQQIDPSILQQLSPDQIEMAQQAFKRQNSSDIELEDIPILNESLQENKSNVDVNIIPGKYGYEFFSTMPTSTSAIGDLPLPNDYKISFRDQLTVILSGSRDAIFDLNVKLDGTILFPELGSISVVGKTLGEVKDIIESLVEKSFIGVKAEISIKNLSAKKITIVGAVKTPGTFLVNPFSTITSALAYSGGISKIGTLRDIKLIRNNGETFTFDLYELLIKGDRSKDITIEAGDTILINAANQFVTLSGQVKRPAIYEVLKSETIQDIVDFGLGFTDIANKSNISIRKLDLESTSIIQENIYDLGNSVENLLSVDVFSFGNENISSIEVLGAVEEPGFYSLSDFTNLEDLVNNVKFNNVYPWIAVLEQFDRNQNIKSSILFNLDDPRTYKSVKLLPNSKIKFFQIDEDDPQKINRQGLSAASLEKISDYALRINHKNKAYNLPVFGEFKLTEFIKLLDLDMSYVEDKAIYVSPLENKIETKEYDLMFYSAEKFNTITFKSPVNDLIGVSVEGAVFFPGNYTLNQSATIQDLYNLLGSFKDNAFLDGIIYLSSPQKNIQKKSIIKARETFNESIIVSAQKTDSETNPALLQALFPSIDEQYLGRISGNFSPNSKASMGTTLNDGDRIIVPVKPSTVSIYGEVLNTANIAFTPGLTTSDVIKLSGGLKEYADKKNIYIIKANGLTQRNNRNIFVNNLVLEPGDTIIVPRKILIDSPFMEVVAPVTQILSNIAFSAAAIDNLSNN